MLARDTDRCLRVAVVDECEIITAGVIAMLAPYRDRARVVGLDPSRHTGRSDLDVVLFDAFGSDRTDPRHDLRSELDRLSFGGTTRVAVFSWNDRPERISRALSLGAAGFIAKSLPAAEILTALDHIHAGRSVVAPPELVPIARSAPGGRGDLSRREAEVVALTAHGLTNQAIADRLGISINSVKTHVRSAYRKLGLSRRSQIVTWALTHGLVTTGPDDRAADRRRYGAAASTPSSGW